VAEVFATSYVAGRAELLRAELAGARRDHGEARRACEDAIDSFEAASALYDLALARLELSRTLLELGREQVGRGEALAARAVFESLGARRDLERVDKLLESRSAGDVGALTELTARELEVLRLVARGMSDAEIAEELVLSRHTVHRHVANIRVKLRLPSRSAAVAYAANEGLL
jgi:ATP/maltotriose-dependent transcriptional regulator MalT